MNTLDTQSVKIWDIAIRIWHWSLVLLLVFLWYSAEIADDLMEWHMRAGRLLLGLIVFRIAWGFIGSDTAKFTQFIRSPGEVMVYLKSMKSKQNTGSGSAPNKEWGHNPAGGLMVLLLIAGLLIQTISGLFTSDGYFYEGPFARSLTNGQLAEMIIDIHHTGFNIILGLVILHILAIALYLLKGENLVRPMITGRKTLENNSMQAQSLETPAIKSPILAAIAAAVVIVATWFLTA